MRTFRLCNTFAALVRFNFPDPDRVNVFTPVEFTARFKAVDINNEDEKTRLEQIEKERGPTALLDEVLTSVEFKGEVEFFDANDQPMTPIDWVKRNQFSAPAVLFEFWSVVSKDIEAKNSKKSRAR